ncbi:MAG: pseudouridine synthase [Victivallales bacterium]|nr:pseudouridine synthase [Victivallales bacterium]
MKDESPTVFPMRLQRFMSLAGVASRRECETIIADGRVAVNGRIVTATGTKVTEDDRVAVDGKAVTMAAKRCYIMLNKPPGYTCTASDPHAEHIVFELVKTPGTRLFTAGRLDRDSEGLLILSNDGDYVAKLTHPRYEILKTYVVRTDRPIPAEKLEELRRGIIDAGDRLRAREIVRISSEVFVFILNEGKKREIRRMIDYAGCRTVSLVRIGFGALGLGRLEPGRWRYLNAAEVQQSLTVNQAVQFRPPRSRKK